MYSERMRYLGVLGLLGECSVYVPEEIREQIETAMEHACADGKLKWKRVINRIEISSNPDYKEPIEIDKNKKLKRVNPVQITHESIHINGKNIKLCSHLGVWFIYINGLRIGNRSIHEDKMRARYGKLRDKELRAEAAKDKTQNKKKKINKVGDN